MAFDQGVAPVPPRHEADLRGALGGVQHVGAGTALKAAFQVAAPLRAGGQNAGAEQGGRHRQSDAEGRRAAEEFTPAEAPEGRLPAEVLQVAVHDLCLSVRRSEEHTSELQSLMRISYAIFCVKKKTT